MVSVLAGKEYQAQVVFYQGCKKSKCKALQAILTVPNIYVKPTFTANVKRMEQVGISTAIPSFAIPTHMGCIWVTIKSDRGRMSDKQSAMANDIASIDGHSFCLAKGVQEAAELVKELERMLADA